MPPAASTTMPRQMYQHLAGLRLREPTTPRILRTSALYLYDANGVVESLNRKGFNHDLPLLRGSKRPAWTQPQRYPPIPLPVLPDDIL